jgi:hypothetical protein
MASPFESRPDSELRRARDGAEHRALEPLVRAAAKGKADAVAEARRKIPRPETRPTFPVPRRPVRADQGGG